MQASIEDFHHVGNLGCAPMFSNCALETVAELVYEVCVANAKQVAFSAPNSKKTSFARDYILRNLTNCDFEDVWIAFEIQGKELLTELKLTEGVRASITDSMSGRLSKNKLKTFLCELRYGAHVTSK